MILLDTHVLIWLAEGNPRLGDKAVRSIEQAVRGDEIAVSAISFWEIAMLHARERLRLDEPPLAFRSRTLRQGIREIAIDGEIAAVSVGLRDLHNDPADRFIAATAIALEARLLTADARLLDWRGGPEAEDAGQ